VGAFALFLAVTYLIGPPLLRRYAERRASERLHRSVHIGPVHLNPFELSVTIDSVRVADRDGAPFVGWDRLYVNVQIVSAWRRELVFDEIRLEQPYGRILVHRSGQLDFADLLASDSSRSDSSRSDSTERRELPVVVIDALHIVTARIDYLDSAAARPFATTVGPLRIDLQHFATRRDANGQYAFSGSTEAGETFSWRGSFAVDPIRSIGNFSIEHVRLGKYRPFYERTFGWDFAGGSVSVTSSYRLDLSPPPKHEIKLVNATLRADTAQLVEHGHKDVVVRIPSLALDGAQMDWLTARATVASIKTSGGEVDFRRSRDRTNNIMRMLGPLLAPPQPGAKRAARWRYLIDRVEANGYTVGVIDSTPARSVSFALSNVSVAIDSIRDDSLAISPVTSSFTWEKRGKISARGRVALLREQGELELDARNVALRPLDPFMAPVGNFALVDGALTLKGKLRFDIADSARYDAKFAGSMSIDHLATVDGVKKETFLKWKALKLNGIDYAMRADRLSVHDILADSPLLTLSVAPDRTTNLAVIFPPSTKATVDTTNLAGADSVGAPADTLADVVDSATADSAGIRHDSTRLGSDSSAKHDSTLLGSDSTGRDSTRVGARPATGQDSVGVAGGEVAGAPPPATRAPKARKGETTIGAFRIVNGAIRINDHSVDPAVSFALTKINGNTGALSSVQLNRGALDMTAAVDDVAPVKLSGTFNPLNSNEESRIRIVSEGIEMVPFSPYVGRYFGYGVARGKMALDLKYNVRARRFDSENVITLDDFDFGDKVDSPDATHMPVRLGLSLLKDRKGQAVIDVPAKGNLDDPHFKLGRVIVRAILNVFKKLVTAPWKLMGKLFGGGGKHIDMSRVTFGAGGTALDSTQTKSLDALAKAMHERPGLKLELQGSIDTLSDIKALKVQRVNHELRVQKWSARHQKGAVAEVPDSVTISPEERPALLTAAFAATFPNDSSVIGSKKKSKKDAPPPLSPEEMEARLMEKMDVTPEELRTLIADREKACREYLVSKGTEPDRIFLTQASAQTPNAGGSKVALKLQ